MSATPPGAAPGRRPGLDVLRGLAVLLVLLRWVGRPGWAAPAALLALPALGVLPLRGHALTYLVGGPAIAALGTVLLLRWGTWTHVTHPALRALAWLGTVSLRARGRRELVPR